MEKKKIVILGAGFGGIKTAFLLCSKLKKIKLLDKYEINLVDRNAYHTYAPTLYEIATTSKDLANQVQLREIVTFNLKEIFEGKDINLLQKVITDIDLAEGDIHFAPSLAGQAEKLKFDYLVIALGSETNYYGIPGLQENSLTLKSFKDALMIRDAIWEKVDSGEKELKIVVGGGGSTGVELAGEIKSWLCQLDEELKHCQASVKIIEGRETVLSGFDQRIVKKVMKRLKKIGVELLLNELIEKVEPKKITLKSKQVVDFDIFIWTGGVKASSIANALPLKKEEKKQQVQVADQMECLPQTSDLKLYGKIYGLGDAVCFYNPETNRPVPKVAEAAINQAYVIAHNLIEDIKVSEGLSKQAEHKKYHPEKEFPYVIPVGGKYAVAKVGNLVISGFFGWVLKGLVEIYYLLLNVLPPFQAFKIWLKGLRIFARNDRLG